VAEGRYKDAQSLLHVVLDDRYNPRCKEAIRLLTKLEDPEWYNETIGPHYRARLERVKQLMIEAQGYYDAERDDLAFKRCEQVMEIDPYSKAARALEERIRNRAASKSR
jgi:general secretion pathway protein D